MITHEDMRNVSDADLRQGFASYHQEHMGRADLVTCPTCGRQWCDWCTPTLARGVSCPYQYEHEQERHTDEDAGRVLPCSIVRDVLVSEDDEIGRANVNAILDKLGLSRDEEA